MSREANSYRAYRRNRAHKRPHDVSTPIPFIRWVISPTRDPKFRAAARKRRVTE